jgi:hypothetical protein
MLLAVSAAFVAVLTLDREASAQKEERGLARYIEGKATIVAVDAKNRLVTLKGTDRTFTVQADKRIKDLSQLQPGDVVKVGYYEALAIDIEEPGTAPVGVKVKEGKVVATESGTGAAVAARQVTVTSKIVLVNRGDNSVTFVGPGGRTRWVKVKDPRLQPYLKTLKYQDEVQMTYTEAVAVTLEPPQ